MENKKLYRSETDRVIAGVCGGLGEYFDVDPTLVRIIFVILALWGGVGILLYIVALFLIPGKELKKSQNKDKEKIQQKAEDIAQEIKENVYKNHGKTSGSQVFGLIILFLGIIFTIQIFIPWFGFQKFWPLLLIIIGIFLLAGGSKRG